MKTSKLTNEQVAKHWLKGCAGSSSNRNFRTDGYNLWSFNLLIGRLNLSTGKRELLDVRNKISKTTTQHVRIVDHAFYKLYGKDVNPSDYIVVIQPVFVQNAPYMQRYQFPSHSFYDKQKVALKCVLKDGFEVVVEGDVDVYDCGLMIHQLPSARMDEHGNPQFIFFGRWMITHTASQTALLPSSGVNDRYNVGKLLEEMSGFTDWHKFPNNVSDELREKMRSMIKRNHQLFNRMSMFAKYVAP